MDDTDRGSNTKKSYSCVSLILPDETMVETLYDRSQERTSFTLWKENEGKESASIRIEGSQYIPYSPRNNLLRHGVVRLPSAVVDYGSKAELTSEIRSFISRYCDLDIDLESVAVYYALLTWVYDAFAEIPYLRVRAELGSGKTRFLMTMGAICYKGTFASGSSTVSPIFRLLDAFRGTLILDEADFRESDERGLIVKMLNNGHAKGFPVLRSESNRIGEYSPQAFHVFGPKIIASRRSFSDRALESRCITFELSGRGPHQRIPLNLPTSFETEALAIRNKLLKFRFREWHRYGGANSLEMQSDVEARVNQIFAPLLSLIDDAETADRVREIARESNRIIFAERSMSVEAHVLQVVKSMIDDGVPLLLREIASRFATRHSNEYRVIITPRWIGRLLRSRLHIVPEKSHGTFLIRSEEIPKLERLFMRYAMTTRSHPSTTNLPN